MIVTKMSNMTKRILVALFIISLFSMDRCEELSTLSDSNEKSSPKSTTSITPKQPQEVVEVEYNKNPLSNALYITLISLSCVVGVVGVVCAMICWYRHTSLILTTERVLYRSSDSSVLINNNRNYNTNEHDKARNGAHTMSGLAKRTDYPAYGITGPNPLHEQSYEPPIDKNLNRNAEIYHYNQTKKKMKVLSTSATSDSSTSSKSYEPYDVAAELEINDEETSDGEYTVYECSGFASTVDGPMEIHNPLFDEIQNDTVPNSNSSYTVIDNNCHKPPSYMSNRRNSVK